MYLGEGVARRLGFVMGGWEEGEGEMVKGVFEGAT